VRELSYRKRGVTLDNRYEITVVFSAPPGGWMNYTPFGDDSNFWLASWPVNIPIPDGKNHPSIWFTEIYG